MDLLRESPEGKSLIQKGFGKDLDFAAKVSRTSAVPYLKDDLFLKEDTPKRKWLEDAKKPTTPQKGKSIKITAPLFPKNPEHPVPGAEKGVKKGARVADGKKHEDKKGDDKKHADKKTEKSDKKTDKAVAVPKKAEVKGTVVKPKKAPKPMFSKKTVANAPVKMIRKER